MPKVSVIIPVYNVENYLAQCLDSICNQTIKDIEIICVNDASTDNSLNILKNYADKDKRISIINNESNINAGPSRNKGLAQANGEYIYFIDSDDYLHLNALEKITSVMDNSKNTDFCMFYNIQYNEKTKETENINTFSQFNIKELTEVYCQDNIEKFCYAEVPAWLKVYRHSFITQNNICFDELKGANDQYFYFQTIFKANKAILLPENLIVHRTNVKNSLVMQRTKHFDCMYKSYEMVLQLIGPQNDNIKNILIDITINNLFHFYNKASKEDQKKLNKGLKQFFKSINFPEPIKNYQKYNWYNQYINLMSPITLKKILQLIFSLTNQDTHKVLTILGIKIKFKRGEK